MSAQSARPAIDLDPPAPARPVLALVLALLSVPGVVITWDLVPGGGFTTGVPLGIAAIVIGLQARARLAGAPGSRMALSAVVVAGLAVASVAFFMLAGSPDDADAQAPAGQTITLKELEKGSTFKHVRNTKTRNRRSMLLGDTIVFTNPLADTAGARVGTLRADCAATVGNANFLRGVLTCTVVLTLRDGALMVIADTTPGSPTTTGAVVGGTGAYSGASGVLVSEDSSSVDTITLAG